MKLEDVGDGQVVADFTDEKAPTTVEELQERILTAGQHAGDFITWTIGELPPESPVWLWLKEQPQSWFEMNDIWGNPEEWRP